ncbi:transcription termination/antitermination NusG family protein [Methylobacterium nodulans]|uniref:NusG antitermination factor n=1 Tax=Methylobacterium nodulans (strain LMG 21967 / CNCM I-2342 / ORS 2060) TaxID=460265 RepID=B8ICP2_METNO|nr:transcription termination/antitermination NusG family protein [Methylobacterium nodulans]ACL57453.1 NusG antitermination factor [Methylobacterium nodulans ORS 2060]
MARKRNRRRNRTKIFDAKVTPTHHVRLHRLRVVVDGDRRWYVVRIDPTRERKIREGLETAGFATCVPASSAVIEHRGRYRETRRRAVPGYLFVGADRGMDGRAALWAYHDRVMASLPPRVFALEDEGRLVRVRQQGEAERPFYRVMGPFGPEQLQRFSDKVGAELVAVLYAGTEPVGQFPAAAARILEGQRLDFCEVGDLVRRGPSGPLYVTAGATRRPNPLYAEIRQ